MIYRHFFGAVALSVLIGVCAGLLEWCFGEFAPGLRFAVQLMQFGVGAAILLGGRKKMEI